MTLAQSQPYTSNTFSAAEIAGFVSIASRVVPPLWPLESAIAVNPLAGLEDLDFASALRKAGPLFGHHPRISLGQWRGMVEAGRIDRKVLRKVAAEWLGGLQAETVTLAPGISAVDLLMTRLLELPDFSPAGAPAAELSPAAAFIAKWCAAYCDEGSALPMPDHEHGLYASVTGIAAADPEFRLLAGAGWQSLLANAPREPHAAIAAGLAALGIPKPDILDYLRSRVARLPGWSGHIRWRAEHADGLPADTSATMADLLALWILLDQATGLVWPEAIAAGNAPDTGAANALRRLLDEAGSTVWKAPESRAFDTTARLSATDISLIFLAAAEETYHDRLVPRLLAASRHSAPSARRPAAQLLFCIDVRSEPFRRALESLGSYETLGYAGFFGLPIAVRSPAHEHRQRQLPVLVAPQHELTMVPVPGRDADAELELARHRRAETTRDAFSTAKSGAATAFTTAEVTGPLAALAMLARTFAPRMAERVAKTLGGRIDSVLTPSLDPHEHHHDHCGALSLEDRVGYATAMFRLTGLSANLARMVVLAGHGGSAVNNPYAASLDCGACGGHAGGPNARALAGILNDPAIRERLAQDGMPLPADTFFIAAQHDTTTDEVELFDLHLVPDTHLSDLRALTADLGEAGRINRERRAGLLQCSPEDLLRRGSHWGEVRPEWGLSGNAAFIVGPRSLTRQIDLDGRAFLHSYDWETDPTGEALATILTAPMVVAQWINCQYLFSTLDNERFGSGDKTTQNAVCRMGVVQGNGGDLRIGLPRQSLFTDDGTPFHTPQRLLAVVHAPYERVRRVVGGHEVLTRLFGHGWVSLVIIDPVTGLALRWRPDRDLSEAAKPHAPAPLSVIPSSSKEVA